MIHKIVQYKVNRKALAEVEQAIREFVESIHVSEPNTLYTVYRTGDETVFYHTMSFPSSIEEAIHQEAHYTQEFVEILYPNCEIQPKFDDLVIFNSTSSIE
jgi:quinol monooxygenase YgiN